MKLDEEREALYRRFVPEGEFYSDEQFHAALRAVYNAGLDRAAERVRTFFPDPHNDRENCSDCVLIDALVAAIEAEKGQS